MRKKRPPKIKKYKPRLSTSKRVLYFTLIICGIFLSVIIVAWVLWDRTDAAGLAGVVMTPATAAIGFYSWKAKAENLAKYGQKDKITMNGSEDYSE